MSKFVQSGGRWSRLLLPVLTVMATAAAWAVALPAAHADLSSGGPCDGPFSIAVHGPGADGNSQPIGVALHLTVLNGSGVVLPGDYCGTRYAWSSGGTSAAADVPAVSSPGTVTYSVDLHHTEQQYFTYACGDWLHPNETCGYFAPVDVVYATVRVPVTYVDPGPTGTTVTAAPASAGLPVQLTAAAGGPAPAATWTWHFDDGSPDVTGADATTTHTWPDAGDHTVTVTVTDAYGLTDAGTTTFHVYGPLTADFTLPGQVVLGSPARMDGSSSTTDPDATISSYAWDFGDGQLGTGKTVSHLYPTTGAYTVRETITDSAGRTASATHGITVTEPVAGAAPGSPADLPPVASWQSTPAHTVAASPVAFDASGSSDPDGHVTGYSWNFGGGHTASSVNPTFSFPQAGDYPVTLTVTDDAGLTNSSTQTVHVAQAPPTAAFAVPADAMAGSPTAFDGTGSQDPDGSVTSWSWDFGDSTPAGSGATPTHLYQHAGSYDVTLTVTDDDGNTDSVNHPVTVARGAPVAAFTPPSAVGASAATFDGSPSTDADGTLTDWTWDFGDGSPVHARTTTHAFPRAGTYPVTLSVTDDIGLTSSVTHDVTVAGAPPVAAFSTPTASAGVAVGFDGTGSSDPDGTVTGYHWRFGDGTPDADGAAVQHAFPTAGSFPVTLTVTDDSGATNAITHLVVAGTALPTAAFTGPSTATTGQTLSFDGSGSTDPASTITAWSWTFGDGRTAAGPRATHAYTAPGTYQVNLTVVDAAGMVATVTHPVTVRWPATDLAVATAGTVSKAGQYAYTITVTNLGKAAAHSVRLLATLDPTQVLAAKPVVPTGMSCAGVPVGATGTVTCTATTATLAAGKSWVVKVTVKQPTAPKVTSVTEISKVDAANPDPVPANNTARMTTALAVKH